MTPSITAAFATLGLVFAGSVAAVLTTGFLEGIQAVPQAVSSLCGVGVFAGTLGLTARVAVDIAHEAAVRAVAAAAVMIALIGIWAAVATESAGEGVEPEAVLVVAGGLGVLLVSTVVLVRRHDRHRAAGGGKR